MKTHDWNDVPDGRQVYYVIMIKNCMRKCLI